MGFLGNCRFIAGKKGLKQSLNVLEVGRRKILQSSSHGPPKFSYLYSLPHCPLVLNPPFYIPGLGARACKLRYSRRQQQAASLVAKGCTPGWRHVWGAHANSARMAFNKDGWWCLNLRESQCSTGERYAQTQSCKLKTLRCEDLFLEYLPVYHVHAWR